MFESLKPSKKEPDAREKESFSWKLERLGAAGANALWEHTDNPDAPMPLDRLFDPKLGKFKRAEAFFATCRDMIPDGLFARITSGRYQYDGSVLPIDPARYQFDEKKVGNGAECNVYKLTSLDPEQPSLVIKIDNGLRRGVDVLVERGKQIRTEFEEKKEWYRELPDLIPEELQFISKSPRGGRNALFTIQEYYGTADQIHDLFRGYPKAELIEILRSDPALSESFRVFAKITLDRVESHDEVIDTIGDRNVVLVDQPDGTRVLRLLDPHIVKHPSRPPNELERNLVQADLDFLREVSAAVQE